MSDTTTRVVLVDDHAMVREGIRHVLATSPGIDIVGEAANGDSALHTIREHEPDIVLLDISLPGKTGLAVAAQLQQELPHIKVLILSMHDHARYVIEAVKVGVQGYILKDAGADELRKAIAMVSSGTQYFSPGVVGHLGAAVRQPGGEQPAGVHRLTNREKEVLLHIAKGLTNKETAKELGISTRTVETHRESLMKKVDIRTVAGLTRFALETGLLQD